MTIHIRYHLLAIFQSKSKQSSDNESHCRRKMAQTNSCESNIEAHSPNYDSIVVKFMKCVIWF